MKTIRNFLLTAVVLLSFGLIMGAAGQIDISGHITDENGKPLKGVTVSVKSNSTYATSDAKGRYTINAPKNSVLVFSHPGYGTAERTANNSTINVQMFFEISICEDLVEIQQYEKVHMDLAIVDARHTTKNKEVVSRQMVKPENMASPAAISYSYDNLNDEEYAHNKENRFINVSKDPLSTFALEVDGASYSNVRRMISRGAKPTQDAVRVEEFVNYFSYDYPKPSGRDPLKISYEIGQCPWNNQHQLVRVGVKAKEIPSDNLPATNFVFLIDVSGSMYGGNRLPLVKSSLKLLVNNLREKDRVAIVTYAGAAGEALSSTSGTDKQKIREALDNLTAGGSTAGGEGIKLAYKIARKNFIEGGNNRIILATDGDFNVGVSSAEGLESLIEQERKSGVFLTVLGYGMGNYKDKKMQVLAEKGNGNYAYIDNLQEANKVLVNEFGSTMYTVAKDVKLQVEFNPARVQSFRLVGYESRLLEHEDFNDDTKDAGEIGAGHSVTAFYEIVPVGISGTGSIDPLKYQSFDTPAPLMVSNNRELMTIKMRYKAPDGEVSSKIELPVVENNAKLSEDFYFAASVAMFGQLLQDSDFKGNATYDQVINMARKGLSKDDHGYRREFVRLAETAKGMVD